MLAKVKQNVGVGKSYQRVLTPIQRSKEEGNTYTSSEPWHEPVLAFCATASVLWWPDVVAASAAVTEWGAVRGRPRVVVVDHGT